MSSRSIKKPSVEQKTEKQAKAKKTAARPTGRTPQAMVVSRHGPDLVSRGGRGFSYGEMSGAALPVRLADLWRVPMDVKRRSVLEPNIRSLRAWYSPPARDVSSIKVVKDQEKSARKRAVRKKKEQ